MFLGVVACFSFVACGQEPEKIEVKEGTIQTTVEINSQLNLDSVVIRVTYKDKSFKDVAKNSEMEFSNIDTSTVGDKTLTIKYLGLETSVTITVVASQETQVNVVGFSKPQSLVNFENYRKEGTDENSFMIANKNYVVGEQNAFVINPIITIMDENDQPDTIDFIECEYKIELYNSSDDSFAVVEDYSDIVAISDDSYAFDFTANAVGNVYRISMQPALYEDLDPISFVVEVKEGYNVHNTKELSVLDNNPGTKSVWQEFKQANNIPENVETSSIILHNDMVLTMQDIPSDYYYKEGDSDITDDAMIGKLRTRKSIYTRDTKSGETFTLYGNYFQIDASQIELVPIEEMKATDPDTENFGHSAVFAAGGDNDNCPTTLQGNVVIDTIKFMGNANRDEDTALAGGLLMVLSAANELTMTNVVARSFLTNLVATYMQSNGNWEVTTKIESCKMYDSFSNMLYYYGVKNNFIKDSVLSGAGGPVMNLVHVNPGSNKTTKYTTMEMQNTVAEAFVNGSEAWFAYNGATKIATDLLSTDTLISQTSKALSENLQSVASIQAKTFSQNGKANFVCMFAANDPLGNSYPIMGKITIKDKNGDVVHIHDMQDSTYMQYLEGIKQVMPGAENLLPFFQSDSGVLLTCTVDASLQPNGLGKVTATGIAPLFNPGTPSDLESENIQRIQNFFSGNYLGIYANGGKIGACVDYYNA